MKAVDNESLMAVLGDTKQEYAKRRELFETEATKILQQECATTVVAAWSGVWCFPQRLSTCREVGHETLGPRRGESWKALDLE